jgi:2,4-dienoyl-CoA reductase-like NADH-dependent reductase (Old Yellow Enzyme family)
MNIGKMEVKNRFVRSATLENMAKETGEVTEDLIKLCSTLAKGEVGLIIPGYLYIHPLGKAFKYQTGIHNNNLVPELKKLVDAVHKEDGKIALQIVHAGMQTFEGLIGTLPAGPSADIFNPISLRYSREMTEEEIQETIRAFEDAAKRVVESGADAIQLHAAHGYLINQFLSPFYNQRKDQWGGSEENQFRYLKELVVRIKKIIPTEMPFLVKLNTLDYTPDEGITPDLALKYTERLVNLGIDAIEISCGSSNFSIFNMCRGDVPVQEIIQFMPESLVELATQVFQEMVGQYNMEEAYNLHTAKIIKPIMGSTPLILVGGLRNKVMMEDILEKNHADFISMSRPFIREPFLVKNFKEGKQDRASCVSCNRCLAAVPNDLPVRCYTNKFPGEKKPTIYLP